MVIVMDEKKEIKKDNVKKVEKPQDKIKAMPETKSTDSGKSSSKKIVKKDKSVKLSEANSESRQKEDPKKTEKQQIVKKKPTKEEIKERAKKIAPKTSKKKAMSEPKVKQSRPKQQSRKPTVDVKLFGRWEAKADVKDLGLRKYMRIEVKLLPRSAGVHRERFHKSRMHIVERLALALMVSGHSGKRHRLSSGRFGGGYYTVMKKMEKALERIEKKENKNPIDVLATAIENAAPVEEIISFQVGSIIAREAVVTAPLRRIDKALRSFSHGAYKKSFNRKKTLDQALAEEVSAAYHGSNQSFAIQERERIEREASGAR